MGLAVRYLGLAIVTVLLMNIVAAAAPVLAASPNSVKLVDEKQAKGLREALKAVSYTHLTLPTILLV